MTDALNEDEEVDALMEYLEEPVRRSNPKIFMPWILKNECAWDVWQEGYANAGILCYISSIMTSLGSTRTKEKMAGTDIA